jgi:hypothetical protein
MWKNKTENLKTSEQQGLEIKRKSRVSQARQTL